jgi:hypothetical protein
MEILQILNPIREAIKYRGLISPYDTNLSADLKELSPEELKEMNARRKTKLPVKLTKKKGPTKGLLKR